MSQNDNAAGQDDATTGENAVVANPTRVGDDNLGFRDAGDILADEVREGRWNSPMEERDEQRGG